MNIDVIANDVRHLVLSVEKVEVLLNSMKQEFVTKTELHSTVTQIRADREKVVSETNRRIDTLVTEYKPVKKYFWGFIDKMIFGVMGAIAALILKT